MRDKGNITIEQIKAVLQASFDFVTERIRPANCEIVYCVRDAIDADAVAAKLKTAGWKVHHPKEK